MTPTELSTHLPATAMPETAINIVLDRIKHRIRKTHRWLLESLQDLDEAMWSSMPSPTAPSIGWHAWHSARCEDGVQAILATEPACWLEPAYRDCPVLPNELWALDGYVEKWGLDRTQLGRTERGIEVNCSALLPGKALMLPYVTAVLSRVEQVIETIDEQRLQMGQYARRGERLLPGADLEESVAENLVFVISHTGRHLGMIEALRGGFGIQGSATN